MISERIAIDTSEGKPVYFLAVGENPTYIKLSAISYYLIEQRSQDVSFETIASNLSHKGKNVSPRAVELAYDRVLEKIAEIERNPRSHPAGFWWRKTLIPQPIVRAIANRLAIAFTKPVAYSLLGLIGFSIAIAPQHDTTLITTPTDWFWAYLLFTISLIAHEFGHASACARYGAKPSDIGFTLYLIYPALYSDVTDAWKLKRWQRVMVDAGGVFFQLVIAALYVIIYKFTDWIPLKLALLAIAASCILTLNPIFKFDGYWVVSDALGVTNLSKQPLKLLKYGCDRLLRRPVPALPQSPLIVTILCIYTAIGFAFWGYFLWIVIPLFVGAIAQYPSLINQLISQLSVSPHTVNSKLLESFFASSFMLLIAGLILGKICHPERLRKTFNFAMAERSLL